MTDSFGDVVGLKPLVSVLERDEPWRYIGNRTLEQHHGLIDQYALHAGVPNAVSQHYENARNTWLYAFFSYRLLQVAILQVHLAGEVAVRERAKLEGVKTEKKSLEKLFEMALARRWLLDSRFEVVANGAGREAERLEMLRSLGDECQPFVGPLHEQDYAQSLVGALRKLRNSLAHGEVMLMSNLGWAFQAVRDLINQLFPEPDAKVDSH